MTLLQLDLASLLDASKVGRDAARALENEWSITEGMPEDRRGEVLANLREKRDALRSALLARAGPIVAELAKKRGASAVLERGSLVWAAEKVEDITAAVIKEVDAQGPLKL
ncbi:MAG: OmpH family outer membrane protein [Myxococcales bacterium]|nr:OmpH family outer membrane protein [Myxococcales bacterium]